MRREDWSASHARDMLSRSVGRLPCALRTGSQHAVVEDVGIILKVGFLVSSLRVLYVMFWLVDVPGGRDREWVPSSRTCLGAC